MSYVDKFKTNVDKLMDERNAFDKKKDEEAAKAKEAKKAAAK